MALTPEQAAEAQVAIDRGEAAWRVASRYGYHPSDVGLTAFERDIQARTGETPLPEGPRYTPSEEMVESYKPSPVPIPLTEEPPPVKPITEVTVPIKPYIPPAVLARYYGGLPPTGWGEEAPQIVEWWKTGRGRKAEVQFVQTYEPARVETTGEAYSLAEQRFEAAAHKMFGPDWQKIIDRLSGEVPKGLAVEPGTMLTPEAYKVWEKAFIEHYGIAPETLRERRPYVESILKALSGAAEVHGLEVSRFGSFLEIGKRIATQQRTVMSDLDKLVRSVSMPDPMYEFRKAVFGAEHPMTKVHEKVFGTEAYPLVLVTEPVGATIALVTTPFRFVGMGQPGPIGLAMGAGITGLGGPFGEWGWQEWEKESLKEQAIWLGKHPGYAIGATIGDIIAMKLIGEAMTWGARWTVGRYRTFRGIRVPSEEIIVPEVLRGPAEFPTYPPGTPRGQFLKVFKRITRKYSAEKYFGELSDDMTRAFHVAGKPLKGAEIEFGETAGAAGLHVGPYSPHFARGPGYESITKLFGIPSLRPSSYVFEIVAARIPSVVRVKGVDAMVSWLTKQAGEAKAFISPAGELGKTEIEALIAPGTEIAKYGAKYYTVLEGGVRVPIFKMAIVGGEEMGKIGGKILTQAQLIRISSYKYISTIFGPQIIPSLVSMSYSMSSNISSSVARASSSVSQSSSSLASSASSVAASFKTPSYAPSYKRPSYAPPSYVPPSYVPPSYAPPSHVPPSYAPPFPTPYIPPPPPYKPMPLGDFLKVPRPRKIPRARFRPRERVWPVGKIEKLFEVQKPKVSKVKAKKVKDAFDARGLKMMFKLPKMKRG